MFHFIQKHTIWQAVDDGWTNELEHGGQYELKFAQDLAVYALLRGMSGARIAEVGGGRPRILSRLAAMNECYNVDKFEGAGGGPTSVTSITDVHNIPTYIGEFDVAIPASWFDVVFSISVVEHIDSVRLNAFQQDVVRILRPGGFFVHAIDMYLTDVPSEYTRERYNHYRDWVTGDRAVEPLDTVPDDHLAFNCSMATNPDSILHGWGRLVPELRTLRERAQSVSLVVGGRKVRSSP